MSTYSVHVQIGAINFKVHPIEEESLRQTEHCFPVVSVNTIDGGLVEQGDDGVAENQRDEGVHALRTVLDVNRWVEVEHFIAPLLPLSANCVADHYADNVGDLAADVDEDGGPD